jgi:hypothetical protein
MPKFDFISEREMRVLLDLDYNELQENIKSQSWKSVHIIAGSIVEAVLIDYLLSTDHVARNSDDPLKYDLGKAITICIDKNAISTRTAELCSVIRSYRNLIHPGRLLRLSESAPSKDSAFIAAAVVNLILDEIATKKGGLLGLTAEQLVSKIERDDKSLTILKHLIREMSSAELERFIIHELPKAYFAINNQDDGSNIFSKKILTRFSKAYRMAIICASEKLKKQAASRFVKILKEEDGEKVVKYFDAFFNAEDLKYIEKDYSEMIKKHLISMISDSLKIPNEVKKLSGLLQYLEKDDVREWLDEYLMVLVRKNIFPPLKNRIVGLVIGEVFNVGDGVQKQTVINRINDWVDYIDVEDDKAALESLIKIKKSIETGLPF